MNSRLCIVFMVSSPCIQLSSSSVTTSVRFRYACHLFEVISEWSLVHLDFIQSCYGAQCAFWSCCVLIPLSRCCHIRAKHSSTMSQLCFFCVWYLLRVLHQTRYVTNHVIQRKLTLVVTLAFPSLLIFNNHHIFSFWRYFGLFILNTSLWD